MTLTRREMLEAAAGAGAAALIGGRTALAQTQDQLKRTIPSSGEMIPAVGLGSARTFNLGPDDDRAPLEDVMRLFHELGGTLFDTSPSYGRSERVSAEIAVALGVADDLFLANKISLRRRRGADAEEVDLEGTGAAQIDQALELYRRQVIDLEQVHNLRNTETHLATIRERKEAGQVRYVGVTTSSLRQYEMMEQILNTETLDFMQVNYNLATRTAEERLLPTAQGRGVAVIVNLPYGRARLFQRVGDRPLPDWASEFDANSWGQFFLKWILSHPAITGVLPATTKPHHLEDNMGAGLGRLPTPELRQRMVEFFDAIPESG